MRLARYQLYRGDAKGIEQGIESLQQALTAAPGWEIALIELAHAYLRKLTLEPENAAFWLAKAEAIASENELGKRGQRLAALLDAIKENKNIAQLAEWFTDTDILNSARLSYSRMLFGQGKTQEALTQALLVKDNCVNCPYVYQQLAATYMVLGQVQESFDSFARYRLYQNEDKKHPAEIAGYITLNQHSLREMAKWHFQNPQNKPLLPHQRNALALFYLTLGKVTDAEKLLADVSHSTTQFFDLYTLAALHGAKSDFQSSLKYLQRRQHAYPDNDRFKLSVVVALWQLNQYKDALAALKAFNILDDTKGVPDSIDFSLWSVYAALLQEHGNADFAMDILVKLAATLRAGLLPNSHNSDIRLAAVLALQGKNDEALQQLDITLKQGWVSDFNQNWWYLQDSPYFKKLSANPRFQQLVSRYHMEIESIFQQTRKTY